MAEVIHSNLLGIPALGFLDAAQSDAQQFDLVRHTRGPVLARQVHSALVLAVDGPFASVPPEADALVTAAPGLALGIVTADCAPVLFANQERGIIGAAHAGWRGAFGGILEATVDAMVTLGADRGKVRAVIGPTIAQASYEVDEAFRDRFVQDDPNNAALFLAGRSGHFQFDLPGYATRRLFAAGIKTVADLALDTYANLGRFHSYRRSTHTGEPGLGRQFSLIALPG